MKKKKFNFTLNDRMVYYYLVMFSLGPLTQTDVARILDAPKSSVSYCTRKLIAAKAIRQKFPGKTNIYYVRGAKYALIEPLVMADSFIAKHHDRVAGVGPVRVHLNSGWIAITVNKEGRINNYDVKPNPLYPETIRKTLFGTKGPSDITGGKLWSNSMTYDGRIYQLQYLKYGRTQTKVFKISPPDLIHTVEHIKETEDSGRNLFYPSIAPILMELEKHGGWEFEKDESQNYVLRGNYITEYAFDENVTEAIKAKIGTGDFRIGDKLWMDHSPGALSGNDEFETNNLDFVSALNELPALHWDFYKLKGEFEEFRKDTDDRFSRLQSDLNRIGG